MVGDVGKPRRRKHEQRRSDGVCVKRRYKVLVWFSSVVRPAPVVLSCRCCFLYLMRPLAPHTSHHMSICFFIWRLFGGPQPRALFDGGRDGLLPRP